ncbi:MerR family transcriptional regulator [Paenibacillus hamazuiensis]|uniref:MerR family transcriptional regulator n=1 Tax=Paenibacillus hamazuiensis TaxID=2936508 RepID=UPI002010B522|nr:MerR family transcriptional regulator [Paenibacillus hamazuiensis]
MLYTVKEVASLANVTIKTLHHYHKIGLLVPCEISEAGYRLYGTKELERLQQILFYRELDIPLENIKDLLAGETDRLAVLQQQEQLLHARKERLLAVIQTLKASIRSAAKGEPMDSKSMFKGFETEQEWKDALEEQNEYLKQTYDYDMIGNNPVNVREMNEQAAEAAAFMEDIARALRAQIKHDGGQVRTAIRRHLAFLNERGHQISAADFAAQTRLFLQDDFHLQMLENQQTGLAYFLAAAAESYAAEER